MDLTTYLQKIYVEPSFNKKLEIAEQMIKESHAKKETKLKALRDIRTITSNNKLMSFCTNYSLSGEGHRVITL